MIESEWTDHFIQLGKSVTRFIKDPDEDFLIKVNAVNPWFIRSYVLNALNGILNYLDPGNIQTWLSNYRLSRPKVKNIGIIMAGNIPLAGFHDLLCVLISGHKAIIKPSHSDPLLIEFIINELQNINPLFNEKIIISSDIKWVDAIIATGSDNSARHFNYYFKTVPKIIRSNRSSCCILDGSETTEELTALSDDAFLYFGLGCRNVSKIYLPEKSSLDEIIECFSKYSWIIEHRKYHNNYLHNRSLALLKSEPFTDGGHFLLAENIQVVSPVAIIYYERYSDREELKTKIETNNKKIQCVVGHPGTTSQTVKFGAAQFPQLWDYSDGIDTLDFLEKI
jgi:hypothetical protein